MENYICINGEKIELTDEQVKQIFGLKKQDSVVLESVSVGETFKIGEFEFIVCEHLENETTIVLLKNLLCDNEIFGENNNYNGSNVDNICNEFSEKINDLVEGALCEFELDLTADDGLKCYGTVRRKAAPLTANMCRKYVNILDMHKIEKWWWTSTSYSTPKHDDDNWVKCVSPRGSIDDFDYYGGRGVRPFCILKSNIFVSK
jgi:hypothetical protein